MKNLHTYTIEELSDIQLELAQERDFELFNEIEAEINRRVKNSYFSDFVNDLI